VVKGLQSATPNRNFLNFFLLFYGTHQMVSSLRRRYLRALPVTAHTWVYTIIANFKQFFFYFNTILSLKQPPRKPPCDKKNRIIKGPDYKALSLGMIHVRYPFLPSYWTVFLYYFLLKFFPPPPAWVTSGSDTGTE